LREIAENWDDISITSKVEILKAPIPDEAFKLEDVPNIGIVVEQATGEKCQRCWKVLEEVGKVSKDYQVCQRCYDVVKDHKLVKAV
jgi:isoleucyl-tRNA synthetase